MISSCTILHTVCTEISSINWDIGTRCPQRRFPMEGFNNSLILSPKIRRAGEKRNFQSIKFVNQFENMFFQWNGLQF